MKGQITASISAIAAAVMFVACASTGPVNSTETASAGAIAQDKTSSEYQRLADNASQQLICRRQAVTGSRIGAEICLTRAEMEARRERAQELLREIRSSASISQPIPAPAPAQAMPPSVQ